MTHTHEHTHTYTHTPVEEPEGRGRLVAGMAIQSKVDVGTDSARMVCPQHPLQDQGGLVLAVQSTQRVAQHVLDACHLPGSWATGHISAREWCRWW